MAAKSRWKVGDRVFDMPSQSDRTIIARRRDEDDGEYIYEVDAPPDPTGDGAFPDGWRNDFEIGAPGIPMKLEY